MSHSYDAFETLLWRLNLSECQDLVEASSEVKKAIIMLAPTPDTIDYEHHLSCPDNTFTCLEINRTQTWLRTNFPTISEYARQIPDFVESFQLVYRLKADGIAVTSQGQRLDGPSGSVGRGREGWAHADGLDIGELIIGSAAAGTVTNITKDGVFINIGAEKDGLLKSSSDHTLRVGKRIEGLKIAAVDLHKKRIKLEVMDDAGKRSERGWAHPDGCDLSDLVVGSAVRGTVTNVTKVGAFVDVGAQRDGLVKAALFKGRTFAKGETVEGLVITDVDAPRNRIDLAMAADVAAHRVPAPEVMECSEATCPAGMHFDDFRMESDFRRDEAARHAWCAGHVGPLLCKNCFEPCGQSLLNDLRRRALTRTEAKHGRIIPLRELSRFRARVTVQSLRIFRRHLQAFSGGLLEGVDLGPDRLVLGGSATLACLLPDICSSVVETLEQRIGRAATELILEFLPISRFERGGDYASSDLDLFVIAESSVQATQRLRAAAEQIQANIAKHHTSGSSEESSLTIQTEHTITIVGAWPHRHVQLIWSSCRSIDEVASFADLDCTSMAYDGTTVWAAPRALRALETAYNVVSPAWLHFVSPKGCVDLRSRIIKYSTRGFGTLLFQCCRHSMRCDVQLKPETEQLMAAMRHVQKAPKSLKKLVFSAFAIKRRFGGNAAVRRVFGQSLWLYVPMFPSIPFGPDVTLDNVYDEIAKHWTHMPLEDNGRGAKKGKGKGKTKKTRSRQDNALAVGCTCLQFLDTLDGLSVPPVSEEASKSILDWRTCF